GSYLSKTITTEVERVWDDPQRAPGNERVRMRRVALRADGEGEKITVRTPLLIELEYSVFRDGLELEPRIDLYNIQGVHIFSSGPVISGHRGRRLFSPGLYRTVCRVPGDLLNEGTHRIDISIIQSQKNAVVRIKEALSFEVAHAMDRRGEYFGRWPGAVHPLLEWKTEKVEEVVATGP
ncbi:MAG TPA: hypothetical protein VM534_03325, partial [Thermoanaerobaculia bacterium]|nr:hypothetical protein [Thermoanaerobaculia bacterium]